MRRTQFRDHDVAAVYTHTFPSKEKCQHPNSLLALVLLAVYSQSLFFLALLLLLLCASYSSRLSLLLPDFRLQAIISPSFLSPNFRSPPSPVPSSWHNCVYVVDETATCFILLACPPSPSSFWIPSSPSPPALYVVLLVSLSPLPCYSLPVPLPTCHSLPVFPSLSLSPDIPTPAS